MISLRRCVVLLLLAATPPACQFAREAADKTAPRAHPNLNSTLYVQTSVEYAALTRQSFRLARLMLRRALDDRDWTAALEQAEMDDAAYADLPPAVVVDVDETVLDNSPYQARLVERNAAYSTETWQQWVREAAAEPVPGALSFARRADTLGVTVLYLTNRRHVVEEATRRNLRELGFPLSESRDVILTRGEKPGWDGSKTPRRRALAEDFRLLLLVGDNFGDFAPEVEQSIAERRRLAEQYDDYWGTRWIVLPNPQYGSWEGALYEYEYGLSRAEKLERKREQLRTKE
jgi:acid phosphatase